MSSVAAISKKQRTTQADWLAALDRIEELVPRARLDALVDATLAAMRRTLARFGRVAFAWSGGKDSQVLERLCLRAGVTECVLGISDLEYPAFLRWVTDVMPRGLEVVCTGQDLAWLARHPGMLFPQDAATAGKWFKIVQHTAQERYYRARRLDCLVLGRRKADGNYTGPGDCYTNNRGITRYSPLAAWSHEDVLAFLAYERIGLAPFYRWPKGYRCGTHPWPARQWTGSTEQGWREVYAIDPTIVERAASAIPSAADFLRGVA
jgi:3'-phosphoadenosine 5'-phosphosulfate sulfotransferase (PAPS reductase)/FAD synthetase